MGNRGTVNYLAFGTQAGHYGQGGGLPPTGFLEASQLALDDNGNFTIALSTRPQPGNWLPMKPETGLLIVRQTFLDRANEKSADLRIERTDGPHEPVPLTAAGVVEGLRDAGTLVAGASLLFAKWARDFQRHSNALPRFDQEVSNQAGGDPNIAYYHSHWRLGPDEALVIDVVPPPCRHWNFQLNNYWMESLDYRFFTIHLNKHTARAPRRMARCASWSHITTRAFRTGSRPWATTRARCVFAGSRRRLSQSLELAWSSVQTCLR